MTTKGNVFRPRDEVEGKPDNPDQEGSKEPSGGSHVGSALPEQTAFGTKFGSVNSYPDARAEDNYKNDRFHCWSPKWPGRSRSGASMGRL
jgi:hypothetical protein